MYGRLQIQILGVLSTAHRSMQLMEIAETLACTEIVLRGNRMQDAYNYLHRQVPHEKEYFRVDVQKAVRALCKKGDVVKISKGWYRVVPKKNPKFCPPPARVKSEDI